VQRIVLLLRHELDVEEVDDDLAVRLGRPNVNVRAIRSANPAPLERDAQLAAVDIKANRAAAAPIGIGVRALVDAAQIGLQPLGVRGGHAGGEAEHEGRPDGGSKEGSTTEVDAHGPAPFAGTRRRVRTHSLGSCRAACGYARRYARPLTCAAGGRMLGAAIRSEPDR
jgi:hypothetical protein